MNMFTHCRPTVSRCLPPALDTTFSGETQMGRFCTSLGTCSSRSFCILRSTKQFSFFPRRWVGRTKGNRRLNGRNVHSFLWSKYDVLARKLLSFLQVLSQTSRKRYGHQDCSCPVHWVIRKWSGSETFVIARTSHSETLRGSRKSRKIWELFTVWSTGPPGLWIDALYLVELRHLSSLQVEQMPRAATIVLAGEASLRRKLNNPESSKLMFLQRRDRCIVHVGNGTVIIQFSQCPRA